jgi:hypothetical protein
VGSGCAGVLSVQLLRLDGDVGSRGRWGNRLSDSEPTQDEREEAAKLLNREGGPELIGYHCNGVIRVRVPAAFGL